MHVRKYFVIFDMFFWTLCQTNPHIMLTEPRKTSKKASTSRPSSNEVASTTTAPNDQTVQGTDDEFLSSDDDDDDEHEQPTSNDPAFVWYSFERLDDPLPPVLPPIAPKVLPRGHCPAWKCFTAFFTTVMVTSICKWTNVSGTEKTNVANARYNRNSKWPVVDVQEMYVFLALCIAMSVSPKGSERSHFASESRGGYVPQNLGRFMTQTRFNQIKLALRFNNSLLDVPYTQPGHDKLFKLRPVIDGLNTQCKANMQLPGWFSTDEFMVPSFHRTFLRQFMPNKPDRYGMKGWSICDAVTGYMFDFEIYAGKRPGESGEKGLGQRVVEGLVERTNVPVGSVVAMDRFFTSPALVRSLLDKGIFSIGSCNVSRKGWPTGITFDPAEYRTTAQKRAIRGQSRYAVTSDKKMLACCWFDSKPVYMLGSCFQPDGCVVMRKQVESNGTKTKVRVNLPQMIDQYNHIMGGVDLNDGQRKVRNLVTCVGTNKWTVRLFFGLLSIAVNNACILFNSVHLGQKKMPIAEFIIQLQYGLLRQFRPNFCEASWTMSASSSSTPVVSPPSRVSPVSRRVSTIHDHDLNALTADCSPVAISSVSQVAVVTPGISGHTCVKLDGGDTKYMKKMTKKNLTNGTVQHYYVQKTRAAQRDCSVCCKRSKTKRGKKRNRVRTGKRTSMRCLQCNTPVCDPMKNKSCWEALHAPDV